MLHRPPVEVLALCDGPRRWTYDVAMRGGGALAAAVAVVLVVAGCSGGDDGSAVTEAAASAPPTTSAPEPTQPPDTTAPPTTAAPTTENPTTTIDDEAATLAAVEQAYLDSHAAYLAAARDPSNPELRAEVDRLYTGPNLERTTDLLDSFVARNYVARPDPEDPSRTEILAPAQLVDSSGALADLVVCEVNTEQFYETDAAPDGGDALVTDEMTVRRLIVLFEFVDGRWVSRSGERLADLSDPEDCAL